MESSTFVLLSGALTFGVPVLFALRELASLRRDRGAHGRPGDWRHGGTSAPPGPRGGAREQPRPLPACLIEAAQGAPVDGRTVKPELEAA